eukprot:371664-Hanusia_phi.AAC.1
MGRIEVGRREERLRDWGVRKELETFLKLAHDDAVTVRSERRGATGDLRGAEGRRMREQHRGRRRVRAGRWEKRQLSCSWRGWKGLREARRRAR